MPGASSGVFHTSTELGCSGCVVLIEIAVVRVAHAAVGADLMVVAELHAVRTGDVRHNSLVHMARVVLALNLIRAPGGAAGDGGVRRREGTLVGSHLPLRVDLSRLHVPQRRAARLLDAGHRRAQPVEQRPGIARLRTAVCWSAARSTGCCRPCDARASDRGTATRAGPARRRSPCPCASTTAARTTRSCASARPAASAEATAHARTCRGTS